MKKLVLSLVVIAALFGILEAVPFQTLGMLRTPDAYVLPHKAAEFALVGYYRDVVLPVVADDPSIYFMAGVGLVDRVELGIFLGDKVDDDFVYFLNAKVKVLDETLKLPQITVGMDNIFSPVPSSTTSQKPGDDFYNHPDKSAYEAYSPYAVASKQAVLVGVPWMFNLGIGANRFAGQASRARVFNGLFTSIEISPFRNFYIQGEYSGHDFNAGIKYAYNNWGVKLGMSAIEDLTKDNGYEDNLRIALGLTYLMDQFAEAKRSNGRPNPWEYASAGFEDDQYIGQPVATDGTVRPTLPSTGKPVESGGQTVAGVTDTGFEAPGLSSGSSASYSQVTPEINELLAELKQLRDQRQKAQKSLDELRLWIQQLKAEPKP